MEPTRLRFAFALVVASMLCTCQCIAGVTGDKDASVISLHVDGQIDEEAVRDLDSLYQGFVSKTTTSLLPSDREPVKAIYVFLNSPGGDVKSAMAIGRYLRSLRAWVFITKKGICASACVLVYAGGVRRFSDERQLIVHRPYFVKIDSGATIAARQSAYDHMQQEVRDYLREMNVSPMLWDEMASILPSEGRALTPEDERRFLLLEVDPVEEEASRQTAAAKLGVSIDEYLRREASSKERCQIAHILSTDSIESMVSKTRAYADCYGNVMKGN